jgi:protocatechuate 3,4-dioxygenase beta subunit
VSVLRLSVLALSLFSSTSLSQQVPAGSIEGIVVRADTEQPIANVQVFLTAGSAPARPLAMAAGSANPIASVTTGADGKFAFKDLKPEKYRVSATGNGFGPGEFGQRAFDGQGRPIFLDTGQSVKNANIRMIPAGTVRGRIFDQDGQPATGAPVQLLRAVYDPQGKHFQLGGTASVDDRGEFRIYGVTPGHYYLVAGSMAGSLALVLNRVRGSTAAGSALFSLSYYPNVSDVDQATTIEVKPGNELSVDMRLTRETQRYHVRGRVIVPPGTPIPQSVMTMLGFRTVTGSGSGSANMPNSFDPSTGTFDISNVPTGEFTLQIPMDFRLGASVPIRVMNGDIDGLVLMLTDSVETQGKLIVEGQAISTVPDLYSLRLSVRSVTMGAALGIPFSTAIDGNGSFQVSGLREGEYRAQLTSIDPGFYVKSITYGGEDILGKTFHIRADSARSFVLTIKATVSTILGTVKDSNSKPAPDALVVFIPEQRERLDLFRVATTDSSGRFTMKNLAPGEYKVFSPEGVEFNSFYDPDFLAQYEQFGKVVSVKESSDSSVDVNLIPVQ